MFVMSDIMCHHVNKLCFFKIWIPLVCIKIKTHELPRQKMLTEGEVMTLISLKFIWNDFFPFSKYNRKLLTAPIDKPTMLQTSFEIGFGLG